MSIQRELIKAIFLGNLQMVEQLIEQGADINAKADNGWTALHYAAKRGYVEVVKYLIEQGADINAKNNAGETPLYEASTSAVARFLKEKDAEGSWRRAPTY